MAFYQRMTMVKAEQFEKKGEKKKALEIAKSLLDYLQPEVISKATKLPLEEVKKLKNE